MVGISRLVLQTPPFIANRRMNHPKKQNEGPGYTHKALRPTSCGPMMLRWLFSLCFKPFGKYFAFVLLFFANSNLFRTIGFFLVIFCSFSGYLNSLNMSHRKNKSRKRTRSCRHFPAETLFRCLTYIMKVPRQNGARTKTIFFRRFFSRRNVIPSE